MKYKEHASWRQGCGKCGLARRFHGLGSPFFCPEKAGDSTFPGGSCYSATAVVLSEKEVHEQGAAQVPAFGEV